MKIEVTQADIDNGVPGSAWSCAIALAARRACGGPYAMVEVGTRYIRIDGNTHSLPLYVIDAMSRFDTQHPRKMEPFSFDVETP